MAKFDTPEFINSFRQGNEKAFAAVYDQFYGPLYFFIRRILNNNGDSQDIVAETFLKLWRLKENFETVQNIKAFLYITSRNAAINILRQRKESIRKNEEISYLLDTQLLAGPSPHDELRAEIIKQLMYEIENLPAQCGRIVKMSFVEGTKNAKIAQDMGLTIQTVKNQKTRGIKLLKEALTRREWQLIIILQLLFKAII
jgi:RNA polymerase sigma-70 factor (family 1)